ncbi:FecR family protein [Sulfurospirillum arcachonense]|uniref:FecR family protein n=1 Tax=Sulfurospirillum arcachonense TaxID=57666 RepID=UPI00046AAC04|nr:FecR domain-containing protein [Sulfurospirillum arcachonense]
MLRIFFILFCLLSYLFSADIAIVKVVNGDTFAKRDSTMLKLKVGNQLQVGDTLITKAGSNIGIIFHDGTILSLGENSILTIDEFLFKPIENEFKFDIDMSKGLASFESGKIGTLSPESVKFKVPEGTVGIRGTKFYVEVK